MPKCIGFYVDKHLIRYAKINRDKNTDTFILESYGVRFYDDIIKATDEIVQELGQEPCTIATNLINESYQKFEVFSELKPKDRNDFIQSEFSEYVTNEGLIPSALEMRFHMVHNTGNLDKFNAVCAYVNKTELTGINMNFSGLLRTAAIAPIGISVANLFRNKGIDEDAIIINIENKTTVTTILRNEIQDVVDIPIGMDDILEKLADKYNSYTKAYEACKKVSVYIEDVTALDEESRDILDAVLPVLFDIRNKVDEVITPIRRQINSVYLSGVAVSINNIDLYFQEIFPNLRCEVIKPFFITSNQRDIQNEIVETNSAIALALDGLGLVENSINFCSSAKKDVMFDSFKQKFSLTNFTKAFTNLKLNFKDGINGYKEKKQEKKAISSVRRVGTGAKISGYFSNLYKKLNSPVGGKVKVDYDIETAPVVKPKKTKAIKEPKPDLRSPIEIWMTRLCTFSFSVFLIYFAFSIFVSTKLRANIDKTKTVIAQINQEIVKAENDVSYISKNTAEYNEKIKKLQSVMDVIATEKRKSNFDIPNFMSQLMFIIPQGVSITNIDVSETGVVTINAQSPQYASLGYFVSRIKLEKVLLDVEMEVINMNSMITIKVEGVLP